MLPLALAVLLGVGLTLGLAELYINEWLAALLAGLIIAIALRIRPGPGHPGYRVARLCCVVLAAALWASLRASFYLEQRLPEDLAGKDILVSGRVVDIPQHENGVQRFEFELDGFDLGQQFPVLYNPPQRLRLSWYYAAKVNAGERWQLRLRLKPPHGFYNPGGFDYEGWLYQQGIHATGYVRDSKDSPDDNQLLATASAWSLDHLRQAIFERISERLADQPHVGMITALAVGERAAIDQQQWQQLISTGTNHLMAISGLHIGLAAGFGYLFTRRVLCRLMPARCLLIMPAQHMAIISALLLAAIYALLAGLTIPTQRALLMLASFSAAWLLRRNQWAFDALGLALLVILIWQPVSVLSAGFWFSFLAVGVIFYVFRNPASSRQRWLRWGGIQFCIALALMPLSLFMFQQSSLVSPLANLVMVPYVSLLVVPLVLLGMLLLAVWSWAGDGLLWLAAELMQFAWPLIDVLAGQEFARWVRPQPALWVVVLAMLGLGWLMAPRARMPSRLVRAAGGLFCLPLVLLQPESPEAGSFELHQLDVGQGLSVVIRTRQHALVYDTGAKMGSRLDAGDAVVVPFLRQLGVTTLDRLVVSHGDADHIGGAEAILRAYPRAALFGRDIEALAATSRTACSRGQRWHWDGVDFEFLHPDVDQPDTEGSRNNHSCILRISNAAGAALLTGDIEHDIEAQLLKASPEKLKAEVMLVPHHGSKTSSTDAFIAAVSPAYALLPAGYRNRYRLPAAEISQRYLAAGAKLLISGQEGTVSLVFSEQSGIRLDSRHRRDQHHYWNHLGAGMAQ